MTKVALRKKLHQYIDNAEGSLLEIVYDILKDKKETSDSSLLTRAQKRELDKRAKLYKEGRVKTIPLKDVIKKQEKKYGKL
jgi:hypothetical protein